MQFTKKRKVIAILLAGLLFPFVARLPGAVFYGMEFLLQYLLPVTNIPLISVINLIPFTVLAVVAARSSSKEGVVGAVAAVFGLDLLGHGTLDLRSSSTAAVAVFFIPFFAFLLMPVGYLLGRIVGGVAGYLKRR